MGSVKKFRPDLFGKHAAAVRRAMERRLLPWFGENRREFRIRYRFYELDYRSYPKTGKVCGWRLVGVSEDL